MVAALLWRTLLGVLVCGSALCAQAEEQSAPFRLCADPANLPFSSEPAATPGLYVELGQKIAAALGRAFVPVWVRTYFTRHELRTTLLAGRCDAFIGLPAEAEFMGPRVIFSRPILRLGYALVTPQRATTGGPGALTGRRVAVQFATPPQSLLAKHDDITSVTVLSPEEGMRDLADGKVDAAFVWGPSAGWINQSELSGAYTVQPIDAPGMQWQAAIGFARDNVAMRDAVDVVMERMTATIQALMVKYGFPVGQPRPLQIEQSTVTASDDAKIAAGRNLFNENCSHCHGPDAVQGVPRQNLRLLRHRYADEMDETFMTTVTHGRVTKGMPNWSGILNDTQFRTILAFLHSVQDP